MPTVRQASFWILAIKHLAANTTHRRDRDFRVYFSPRARFSLILGGTRDHCATRRMPLRSASAARDSMPHSNPASDSSKVGPVSYRCWLGSTRDKSHMSSPIDRDWPERRPARQSCPREYRHDQPDFPAVMVAAAAREGSIVRISALKRIAEGTGDPRRPYRMKTRAAVSTTVSNPSETTLAMKSQSRCTLHCGRSGQSPSTKIKSIARASTGSRSTRTRAKLARDRTARCRACGKRGVGVGCKD
jgi:hypothetical protein